MLQGKRSGKEQLKIVGIGASASGLQALELFFSNCPIDSGISFVVLQHLSPDLKSVHDSLLARITSIPITVATDNLAVEPNHIYLIPSEKNIVLQKDTLLLMDRASLHQLNLPIDIFFISLAKEKKERAVGVVLSGTGSDGTIGAAAIKEAGGVVIVQKPEESGFAGMPLSVIHAGLADFVLNASQIPLELTSYFDMSGRGAAREKEKSIEKILEIIKDGTKYDFTTYRKQTLRRRIIKRKNINKFDQLDDYRSFLLNNPEEQQILANEFLIGVTRFFRDKLYFQTIKDEVIPEIIAQKKKGNTIKLWVIGCVTGEEAYSLAILLKESLMVNKKNLDFKIFATDINVKSIEKASKGFFGQNIAADIDPEYLSKYFEHKGNGFLIKPQLRRHIIFSVHDILHNPPFNKMDLISCRNLLIYFQQSSQEKTIKSMLYALNVGGYLFLGSSESLGGYARYFEVVNHRGKIFKKVSGYDNQVAARDLFSTNIEIQPTRKLPEFASELTIQFAKKLALATHSICICINENIQVLEVYGSLRLVGSLPSEGFSSNLLKLLPKEFQIPIATAIRKLSKTLGDISPISKLVHFTTQGKKQLAHVVFDRFDQKTYPHEKFYIIAIHVKKSTANPGLDSETTLDASTSTELLQMQNLLEETKENLQLTIEELEAANEEAQANNEELVSSNEELQSTNEELQSVNEELHTVNAELQEKNIELLELNADIENLINSSHIATLFLDDRLHIRRFTPSIKKIIDLQESDVGRSITNFSLPDPDFIRDLRLAATDRQTKQKEIVLESGRRYMQEINLYVTAADRNQGTVVNYVDITELNRASDEIREKTKLLKDLLELFPGNFYIFNLEREEITMVNEEFQKLIGYSAQEVYAMGNQVIDRLCLADDRSKVKIHLRKMTKAKPNASKRIQFRMINKKGESIRVASVNRPLEWDDDGKVRTVLAFLTNIEKT